MARPSMGGAASRMRKAPSCRPATSVRLALGTTATDRQAPAACGLRQGQDSGAYDARCADCGFMHLDVTIRCPTSAQTKKNPDGSGSFSRTPAARAAGPRSGLVARRERPGRSRAQCGLRRRGSRGGRSRFGCRLLCCRLLGRRLLRSSLLGGAFFAAAFFGGAFFAAAFFGRAGLLRGGLLRPAAFFAAFFRRPSSPAPSSRRPSSPAAFFAAAFLAGAFFAGAFLAGAFFAVAITILLDQVAKSTASSSSIQCGDSSPDGLPGRTRGAPVRRMGCAAAHRFWRRCITHRES